MVFFPVPHCPPGSGAFPAKPPDQCGIHSHRLLQSPHFSRRFLSTWTHPLLRAGPHSCRPAHHGTTRSPSGPRWPTGEDHQTRPCQVGTPSEGPLSLSAHSSARHRHQKADSSCHYWEGTFQLRSGLVSWPSLPPPPPLLTLSFSNHPPFHPGETPQQDPRRPVRLL